MSKIVFFSIPAYGHTNPTLGVVKELVSRGHEVWYYCYEAFRTQIESAGATFIACDNYDAQQKLSPKDGARVGKDLVFSTQLLVDTTLALDEIVCREMERIQPDCIVADSMATWGKAVAWKLGIPFVSSTTTFAFNQYSARIMKQSFGQMLGMILGMPKINANVKRLQDAGYPFESFLDLIQNDEKTDTVVYTSAGFQPCADTFSDKYAFVGPSVRAAGETFTKEKDILVYISMGTVNNDMVRFYRNCIKAFQDAPYQVVMSVGKLVKKEELGVLPAHISVYEQVDQIAVLEQADVFLSHCGMNSVNESLYHGVPLLTYPQTAEQGGVATRVEQVGAGICLRKPTPSAIRAGVEQVLQQASCKENAERMAADFRQCGGASAAADKILSVCRSEA